MKEVLLAKAGALREVLRAEEPRRKAVAIVKARAGLIDGPKKRKTEERLRRRIGLGRCGGKRDSLLMKEKTAKIDGQPENQLRPGKHSDSRSAGGRSRKRRDRCPVPCTSYKDAATKQPHHAVPLLGRRSRGSVTRYTVSFVIDQINHRPRSPFLSAVVADYRGLILVSPTTDISRYRQESSPDLLFYCGLIGKSLRTSTNPPPNLTSAGPQAPVLAPR